ncbi:MAG: HD domain-containing protein [Candidatus Lokiarchaeota archaeon]|nr:HD domain-containing protein [Candidatus Lokiarchaeota archaeon]MBD3337792.1 HD domain-containing protein [Candidatus Lokiarchaeota archaeon]
MKTLSGLTASKYILDPVHGPIPLTSLEVKLISQPIFQRLRKISQLSMTSLIYPGATHSRFLHSLGTLYVMEKMLHSLKSEIKLLSSNESGFKIAQKMRVAALLHDIGHLPFSHTFEKINNEITHEELGIFIILNTKIRDILEKAGIKAKTISSMICGEGNLEDPDGQVLAQLTPLLHSDADADRMDYLLRDAYFTGVPYGNVDIDRICSFVKLVNGEVCFSEKAQHALEDFLFARFQMYQIVYTHKTVIFYNLLLKKIYLDYIEPYRNIVPIPFLLPKIHSIDEIREDWIKKDINNLTEELFFYSVRLLLKSSQINPKIGENLRKLYKCVTERTPVKNCLKIDYLPEREEDDYIEREKAFFEEIKSYPNLISHWSFLRHDPSNPIKIANPIEKDIDNYREKEQIKILSKRNSEKKIEFLQDRTNSYLNSLAKHRNVLIYYYHNEKRSQRIIKSCASKYFPVA